MGFVGREGARLTEEFTGPSGAEGEREEGVGKVFAILDVVAAAVEEEVVEVEEEEGDDDDDNGVEGEFVDDKICGFWGIGGGAFLDNV